MSGGAKKILFTLGSPFSPFYGLVMSLRALLYRWGLFRSHRLPVPVVSVGNLTLGGTGKTPLVMYVVRRLLEHGRRPAIVSRGYGGKARGRVNVVSDGREKKLTPSQAGDEPWLLADALPQVPVVTGARRAEVGRYVVANLPSDVIVLDDGFQHLAVHRDLNLVLFSVHTNLGAARVFPGGELREPFSALRRADALILTGVDHRSERRAHAMKRFLRERAPQAPVFFGEYLPVCLLANRGADTFPADKAKRMRLFGFCAIGNPASFRYTLAREGYHLVDFQPFRDHHAYTAREMAGLVARAKASNAQALITTEKDFVKLRHLGGDFPVLALKVELFMEEGFDHFLTDRLIRFACPPGPRMG